MTGKRREPDPNRLWMTTGEAARILQCLPITVRRRVERGNLEGGQKPSGKWYVYADQVHGFSPTHGRAPSIGMEAGSANEERLTRENAELRGQLADLAAERSRWVDERAVLEARHRSDQSRIQAILSINAATLASADAYRSAAESAAAAMTKFKDAADNSMVVAAMWRDLMAQENVPDSPEGL
jgi:hypothetical protein